jgi:hypothetical protein
MSQKSKINTQLQQKIAEQLQFLTSVQLSEVLDFVEFLHSKQNNVVSDLSAIDAIYGTYKQHLLSSEEFARRKQEEIQLEEAKWQKR